MTYCRRQHRQSSSVLPLLNQWTAYTFDRHEIHIYIVVPTDKKIFFISKELVLLHVHIPKIFILSKITTNDGICKIIPNNYIVLDLLHGIG